MQSPDDLEQPRLITDYQSLRKALAARRRQLGMSQLDLDAVALLTDSHTSRLECGTKRYGDVSLAAVLAALGVALVLVPIEAQETTARRIAANHIEPKGFTAPAKAKAITRRASLAAVV